MSEATLQRLDELLTAAQGLFSQRGYEATSVRDIADALAIKAGSLYARIETKEDLLAKAQYKAGHAQLLYRAAETLARQGAAATNPARRLGRGVRRLRFNDQLASRQFSTSWLRGGACPGRVASWL